MKAFSDISVVLHGPVQASAEREMEQGVTQKAIASVRQYLPGATLILSTWHGQPVEGLDVDKVILNQDPGANVVGYNEDGSPRHENQNRQLLSVKQGLKSVTTPYVVKLRSDNFLTGNHFVTAQQRNLSRIENYSHFSERVVILHRYTKVIAEGHYISRHLCDFFAYGRTQDILTMWDLPLFGDFQFKQELKGKAQHSGGVLPKLSAEQRFASAWFSKLYPHIAPLSNRYDLTDHELWLEVFINNILLLDAEVAGIGSIKRLNILKHRANELSHREWNILYGKYCSKKFNLTNINFYATTWLYRQLKLPIEKLKFNLKQLKKS